MTAKWITFDGSEEHKEMMRNATDGWECEMKNGEVFKNLLNYRHIPFYEISRFMIYEPHPHRDMIIEWANTGRPVYFRNSCGQWVKSTAPQWNPFREYSFNPPINQ